MNNIKFFFYFIAIDIVDAHSLIVILLAPMERDVVNSMTNFGFN